ncbi:MAG: hypothetical protein U1A25_00165, partial [Candidatus Sungbacteria bacterium]|nr:hypothetical protein [Candidatus Sungbacteria bacterium]
EIVNPSSEHIKQWINDAPSFFVSALKGPFGSNLMERSQLTSADIISFRNHHTDSFFQALNTPFGDIFLKEGFSEMTLEQKRQWVQQNLYQFLHFGLISAKARELFEGMQPTASDIQSWYKQNRHDVLWLMRSPVGNKVFNLMDDTVRREALLQDRDGNLALKLNADLAENPNGIFDDLYQAKHALEDEPRGQIPADEHTAGVEIEPLNSEKCEIRTHPFSAKKITELKRFYAAFTDVAQRWAEQNNEEYGYSNSHISIGVFKNDFDLIKKEYKLFHHMIPEAFLYAYSPIERIRYRAIQSVLNTSLDTDIERTINPHIVARLQYRIGCVGGSNAQETAHATQGFENILKATLAIFGSTERLNAYRTFLESKEIRDMLIELRWLIAFRYREAEDYEYEVKKEVLALKEALDSGRKREKDEHIKQEKRRLIRNIKKAETQTVYWTELILERQQTLRQALEAVSR